MKTRLQTLQRLFCVCAVALLMLCTMSLPANATQQKQRVVRVGYPLQRGLTMQSESGVKSGYTYDYLMEISQYTGWTYEFVTPEGTLNEQISVLMDMLQNGEIDLLGAMYYDDAFTDLYSYSGYCYGINYAGLFVLHDSPLREGSLYNLDRMARLRVGVHSRLNEESPKLQQFAQMNGLNIEQVITTAQSDFGTMLKDGRVDALLSSDLAMAERIDVTPIVHFSPTPFYFATTKGNTEMVQQLDYALSTIDKVNPNFSVQLYNQYFTHTEETLSFTAQEQAYLASAGTLEVALYDNKPPFQYVDRKTGNAAGITVEVLNQIAQEAGLTLHYRTVSSYKEYLALLQSGEVDIAADVLSNYQDAQDTGTSLTLPWGALPIVRIVKNGAVLFESTRVAAPYFLKNVIKQTDGVDVTFYDTVEECLRAVQRGKAETSYAGEFCTQYLFNSLAYTDLIKAHQSEISTQNLCFGIRSDSDLNLLTIFNKCIIALPQDTVNEIVYRNTYMHQPVSLSNFVRTNFTLLAITCVTLLALILLTYFYIKVRRQKRIAFENKRYNIISNLANEYFYEYDTVHDTLTLSEKCAEYFGCSAEIPQFAKQQTKRQRGIWQLGEYIVSAQEGSREMACQMPDGSRQWFMLYSTVILNEAQQSYAVGKISSIQEMKSEQLRLEEEASLDGLTGIYNIAKLKKLAQNCLDELDSYSPCALLILDIDSFKQVNDTFGHYSGDAVLVQAANLIAEAFPDGLVGRLGGDEFVALALCIQPGELTAQCEQLCTDFRKKTNLLLGKAVTWSIGVTWAAPGKSYEELYREADEALYQVKQRRKNSFEFFAGVHVPLDSNKK